MLDAEPHFSQVAMTQMELSSHFIGLLGLLFDGKTIGS